MLSWNEIREAAKVASRMYHSAMFRARPLDYMTTIAMDKRSRPLMCALRDLAEAMGQDDCEEVRPVASRMAERVLDYAHELVEFAKRCP